MKVLIDRNIEINAITHRTVAVAQTVHWGDRDHVLEVAQRRRFSPRADETFRLEQLPYVATACLMAREGKLDFYSYHELRMERIRQKGHDEGYFGVDLLRSIKRRYIRPPATRTITLDAVPGKSVGCTEDEQMEFFRSITHPRFLRLRNAVGDKHIDDAFHLWTAEENGLDAFLTMDQKFWHVAKQKRATIKPTVSVLTPKELCEQLKENPTDIEELAADNAPFS